MRKQCERERFTRKHLQTSQDKTNQRDSQSDDLKLEVSRRAFQELRWLHIKDRGKVFLII